MADTDRRGDGPVDKRSPVRPTGDTVNRLRIYRAHRDLYEVLVNENKVSEADTVILAEIEAHRITRMAMQMYGEELVQELEEVR